VTNPSDDKTHGGEAPAASAPAQVRRRLRKAYGAASSASTEASREEARKAALIREHAAQVRRIARRYVRASGGAVELEDLYSVGIIGLLQADAAFDDSQGRPFAVYAEHRIRGAILDELRRRDTMSQPLRRKARALDQATQRLKQRLGRAPTEAELAAEMELDVDEVQKNRREVQAHRFVSYDDGRGHDLRRVMAGSSLQSQTMRIALREGIERLPERLQLVLGLYYMEDLNLREVGEVLGVTEARVCQLHKKAVDELRKVLKS